jgi:hypothetical protein
MNHHHAKTCGYCKKRIFANERLAREHLAEILHRKVRFTKPGAFAVAPYLCPEGNGWHVGRNHNTIMINFKRGRTKNVDTPTRKVPYGKLARKVA